MTGRIAALAALAAACLPACRTAEPAFTPIPVVAAAVPPSTVVAPHLEFPLSEGKTVVWCATLPHSWDAVRRDILGGEPLLLGPPANAALSAAMSAGVLPEGTADAAFSVVVTGEGPAAAARFAREVRERFSEDVAIPGIAEHEFVALSWLARDLRFLHEFEAFRGPILFEGSRRGVRAFGINGRSQVERLADLLGQVTVHRKAGAVARPGAPQEAILEIALRESDDRLLLAMVPREATLRAAWEAVRDAASGTGSRLPGDAVLGVPRIDFDLTRRFPELEGPVTRSRVPTGAALRLVEQRVALRVDQTGARLRSESRLFGMKSESRLLFDRPFLLALARKGAATPYLLLWVGNDDLLCKE